MKNLFELAKENFDIVAVIIASFLALILHAAHLLPDIYILPLILFLLSLHVLHELRAEKKHDEEVGDIKKKINEINNKFDEKEVILIKPNELLSHTKEMAHKNKGEIWWFNICIGMFLSDNVFDNVFKPAIENTNTTKIVSVVKSKYSELWQKEVLPKINKCNGAEKVATPVFSDIKENIAFITIDIGNEKKEADISVWGEPFMAEYELNNSETKKVPRYLIHIRRNSELIHRLDDIFNKYRYTT